MEGEIDHRDELLTDAEREDSLLVCVSRSRGGRLVWTSTVRADPIGTLFA